MKNLTKWLFAFACAVLAVCALHMPAEATDANGDGYRDEEVAAVNMLIENSTLTYEKDDIANWTFVGWEHNGSEYTVRTLRFNGAWLRLPDGKLDTSVFPDLEILSCGGTIDLLALDVTENPELTELHCFYTGITSLDVSQNPKLSVLSCYDTGITELDVTKNAELTKLHCYNLALTSLDLSGNPKLTYLDCFQTDIAVLDLTANTELSYFRGSSGMQADTPYGYTVTALPPETGIFPFKLTREGLNPPVLSFGVWSGENRVLMQWTGVPTELQYAANGAFALDGDTEIGCLLQLHPKTALASLSVSGAALSPVFHGDVLSYSTEVENSVASVELLAEAADADAEISGLGEKALNVGENVFRVTVSYTQDGVSFSREYEITVTRKEKTEDSSGETTSPPGGGTSGESTPPPDGGTSGESTPPPDDGNPSDSAPKTGDTQKFRSLALLCAASLLCSAGLAVICRKRKA
ncbi:MAG: cadherin-like beta sandwich domain-containing protein [Oscillospiraceae bacterium]|nr:cadherin-like beta sandwich domain-containing protein [Oscillospiraceae bacterium]